VPRPRLAHSAGCDTERHGAADRAGPLAIDEAVFPPTGRRVERADVTLADFRDDKICPCRNYFDDAALLEQLLIEA
jgi:hypothetical protein